MNPAAKMTMPTGNNLWDDPIRHTRFLLAGIVLLYFALALLYVFLTPPWQVPDEPAHYNYIRQLAEEHHLPVLSKGDYDQAYITRIVKERFPLERSVEPLEYEDYQPPLYYLLALPVYICSNGSLLALRVFSVLIGLCLIPLAYLIAHELFHERPRIALGAAAFVAFLPQHLAMMAGVNNDSLAEVLLAAVLWLAIRLAQGNTKGNKERLALGLLLGLSLLSKLTTYAGLVLVVVALIFRSRTERISPPSSRNKRVTLEVLQILGPAFVLALPWWIRNAYVYGWPDILGLIQHAEVTVGQPRTAVWIAAHGFLAWLGRGIFFTIQSFWGQFGWMSLPMDFRVYQFLNLLFGTAMIAWFWEWKVRRRQGHRAGGDDPGRVLPALLFILTLLGFVLYNRTFVQHQGRYLFPSLIPIAIATALGIDRLLEFSATRRAAQGLLALVVFLFIYGMARADLPGWPILIAGVLALGFRLASGASGRSRPIVFALPFTALALLNLYTLAGLILPGLR